MHYFGVVRCALTSPKEPCAAALGRVVQAHRTSSNLHELLKFVVSQLTVVALSRPSQKAITVQLQPASLSETLFFKYARVYYAPRTVEEAKKCLQHFFCEVSSVLGQLHDNFKLICVLTTNVSINS